ncbi:MAG: PAS domain-containing protein [Armatimonadetes bacterium]|nr:PAS domain-containing protein [Armatimonadota bacterium]
MSDSPETSAREADQLELQALRSMARAIRGGLSVEGTVETSLDQTLALLGLHFGCVYVRRHDYLLRVASRGLSLPFGPDAIIALAAAPWAQRPFVARVGEQPSGQVPDDLGGKDWMSLPLRVDSHLVGVLLVGGYGSSPGLPPIGAARRVAASLAVAIDTAERFQQLRAILNDTRDVIFRTDLQGRLTYLNPAWQETIGEQVVVALGRRLVSYVEPDQRRRLDSGINALVPRGTVIGRQTLPFRCADQKTRWLDVQARLLRDDRGEIVGSAGVLRDVSRSVRQARELTRANQELRLRAAALEQANLELAEADRLKSEFLATVSHELRTPLGLILGYSEMLLDGIPDEPTAGQRDYLELVEAGGRRLERLIVELLDLARLEAGDMSVASEPTPLTAVIERVRDRLAPTAAGAGVALRSETQPATVLAQPDRLEQVVEILVGNAIKFHPGGGQVCLRVDLRPDAPPVLNGHPPPAGEPRYAQVTVEDDGPGIPPERLALLFRKFVQADGSDTRRHGGLGLGLVIGRALVELMGGQLELHSAGVGQGVAVGFTVPLADPAGS